MSKEAYVSFETAKLLEEKGFDCPVGGWYVNKDNNFTWADSFEFLVHYDDYIPTCSQSVAMRWLREEKGIHIMVSTGMDVDRKPMHFYHANLAQMEEDKTIYGDPIDVDFDTYEDAVEAALKYVLTNLI